MRFMYPTIFIKNGEEFSVTFPDFPEIEMLTGSEYQVIESAIARLENQIITLALNGQNIPLPTSLADINKVDGANIVILTADLPFFAFIDQKINISPMAILVRDGTKLPDNFEKLSVEELAVAIEENSINK